MDTNPNSPERRCVRDHFLHSGLQSSQEPAIGQSPSHGTNSAGIELGNGQKDVNLVDHQPSGHGTSFRRAAPVHASDPGEISLSIDGDTICARLREVTYRRLARIPGLGYPKTMRFRHPGDPLGVRFHENWKHLQAIVKTWTQAATHQELLMDWPAQRGGPPIRGHQDRQTRSHPHAVPCQGVPLRQGVVSLRLMMHIPAKRSDPRGTERALVTMTVYFRTPDRPHRPMPPSRGIGSPTSATTTSRSGSGPPRNWPTSGRRPLDFFARRSRAT